jgi:hypothetical protein
MAEPDPNAPQSAFAYPVGSSTPGTPTGSEQLITKSGTLPGKRGPYYLQSANGLVMTVQVPAPVAGGSASGGDDNIELEIVNTDNLAHVIQSGSGGSPFVGYINGDVNYRATFSGSPIGRVLKLRAYGGNWYTGSGVTLS